MAGEKCGLDTWVQHEQFAGAEVVVGRRDSVPVGPAPQSGQVVDARLLQRSGLGSGNRVDRSAQDCGRLAIVATQRVQAHDPALERRQPDRPLRSADNEQKQQVSWKLPRLPHTEVYVSAVPCVRHPGRKYGGNMGLVQMPVAVSPVACDRKTHLVPMFRVAEA